MNVIPKSRFDCLGGGALVDAMADMNPYPRQIQGQRCVDLGETGRKSLASNPSESIVWTVPVPVEVWRTGLEKGARTVSGASAWDLAHSQIDMTLFENSPTWIRAIIRRVYVRSRNFSPVTIGSNLRNSSVNRFIYVS